MACELRAKQRITAATIHNLIVFFIIISLIVCVCVLTTFVSRKKREIQRREKRERERGMWRVKLGQAEE
jgi:preprotein translocase subunit SecY